MYYSRFTKVIIDYFMTRKPSISRRNRINWHYVRGDVMFSTIKVVSRHQTTQQYGAILLIELTTDDIRNSKAYKEYYACTTGEATPKPKASARKKKGDSASSTTPPTSTPTTTVVSAPRLSATAKGKQPARAITPTEPTDVERTKAEQLKIAHKRSRQEMHISQQRGSGTDEGTGSRPGVPDVPSDDSEEETDESDDGSDDGNDDDDDETVKAGSESDKDDDDNDDEEELTKKDDEDTDSGSEDESNDEEDQELRLSEEARIQDEEEADELYRDVNINQGRGLQVTQNIEDSHVTLTPVHPDGPQESSSMSSFMTSMLKPISDAGVESIFTKASSPIVSLQTPTPIMTPSTIATITTSTFRFDERLRSLETTFSEYRQTNPFVDAVSAIPGIVHQYMTQQMTEAVQEAVQIQTDRLQDSLQRENDEFLRNINENMKKIIKGKVKTDLSEMELKKILIEKMEGNKSIQLSDEQRNLYKALVEAYDADKAILDIYGESTILKRRREDDDQEGPSAGSDRGSKRQKEGGEHALASTPSETITGSAGRSTIGSQSRQLSASESDFVEEPVQTTCQMEEPLHPVFETDFSNFIMNRLNVDTLTPELLAGPTYELMRGSCTSLTKLEYHLEEVYKATTDQLDWVNPEGQQYPHNLLQPLPLIPDNRGCRPLPLIPDNRGRRVIPFDHFINNDLEYLQGGVSSRKYTTYVTKTKAGVSYWGRKRQQFYGFAVNRESALDVYSKRRIIAVTELQIMKWHNYKHLDWISIRRDDDKIYKFKEGDFKRLHLQDIEDMLLLLRRVEDLQLGVESYQKRLNLTKPDTYRPDLKRREAYTAYSNPRGFIYQNKDKKNKLMRIDELYKFSDGMLNDVRNALDDRLKGIQMQYLPTII
nr:hypothetical protein [Tanacetum cinerariifolium]